MVPGDIVVINPKLLDKRTKFYWLRSDRGTLDIKSRINTVFLVVGIKKTSRMNMCTKNNDSPLWVDVERVYVYDGEQLGYVFSSCLEIEFTKV